MARSKENGDDEELGEVVLTTDGDSEILSELDVVTSEDATEADIQLFDRAQKSKIFTFNGCHRLYGTEKELQTTITDYRLTLVPDRQTPAFRWILEFHIGTRVRISDRASRRSGWTDIEFVLTFRDETGAYMGNVSERYERRCRGEPEWETVEGNYRPPESFFFDRIRKVTLGGKYNKRVHWCPKSRRSRHVC